MKYRYEAFNSKGNMRRGTISANSEAEVYQKLKQKGLVVSNLYPDTEEKGKGKKRKKKQKITKADLIMFSRQLAVMIGAGITLTRALFTLADQIENPTFSEIIKDVADEVEGGRSFTESLRKYPKVFPPIYIAMIETGEIGGEMQKALEGIAGQLTKEKEIADNIKSAMMYPVIVFAFAILVSLGMLIFMIPIFEGFFPEGADIPAITLWVMAISRSLRTRWYLWILVLAILGTGGYFLIKQPFFIDFFEKNKFKIPIAGKLIYKIVLARFSRTMATLVDGGISVLEALKNAGPTSGSALVNEACEFAIRGIQDGQTIAKCLQQSGMFPAMVVQMVSIGEETGQIASLLDKVAIFYEEEVATEIKGLSSTIEPLMIIFIGGIVGGLLIAMYLPIFSSVATQM